MNPHSPQRDVARGRRRGGVPDNGGVSPRARGVQRLVAASWKERRMGWQDFAASPKCPVQAASPSRPAELGDRQPSSRFWANSSGPRLPVYGMMQLTAEGDLLRISTRRANHAKSAGGLTLERAAAPRRLGSFHKHNLKHLRTPLHRGKISILARVYLVPSPRSPTRRHGASGRRSRTGCARRSPRPAVSTLLLDDLPVHLGGERLVLELLLDALRFQGGDALGPDQAAGDDEAGQFVAGQQALVHHASSAAGSIWSDGRRRRRPSPPRPAPAASPRSAWDAPRATGRSRRRAAGR